MVAAEIETPPAKTIGFLTSQTAWSQLQAGENRAMREAAQQLGSSIVGPPLGHLADQNEYRRVLGAMVAAGVDALIVSDYALNACPLCTPSAG
jgi:hypothetical protein